MRYDFIGVSATIENLDELYQELKDLGVNVRHATTGATRYGAEAIREQAEWNASALVHVARKTKSGKSPTKNRVVLRARFRKSGQFAVASIFPGRGWSHLRLFEYGTGAGRRWAVKGKPFTFFTKSGRKISTRMIEHPGMPARPWLRPAFDSKSDEAVDRFGARLKDVIDTLQPAPIDEGDE
jgi:HK97 gp10 family phage protein